eukprot:3644120-Prymnesium_polylepis.1
MHGVLSNSRRLPHRTLRSLGLVYPFRTRKADVAACAFPLPSCAHKQGLRALQDCCGVYAITPRPRARCQVV